MGTAREARASKAGDRREVIRVQSRSSASSSWDCRDIGPRRWGNGAVSGRPSGRPSAGPASGGGRHRAAGLAPPLRPAVSSHYPLRPRSGGRPARRPRKSGRFREFEGNKVVQPRVPVARTRRSFHPSHPRQGRRVSFSPVPRCPARQAVQASTLSTLEGCAGPQASASSASACRKAPPGVHVVHFSRARPCPRSS